jgi:hypothetical protein
MYQGVLMGKAKSWITGYNGNLPGHEYGKTRYNIYAGGGPKYARALQRCENSGYEGVDLS